MRALPVPLDVHGVCLAWSACQTDHLTYKICNITLTLCDPPFPTSTPTLLRYQRVLAEHTHQQKKASLAGITGATWPPDHLLLLQHPRIFTLGRGATQENLKFSVDTQVREGGCWRMGVGVYMYACMICTI